MNRAQLKAKQSLSSKESFGKETDTSLWERFCYNCKHFSSLNYSEVWKCHGLCLKDDRIKNFRSYCDQWEGS